MKRSLKFKKARSTVFLIFLLQLPLLLTAQEIPDTTEFTYLNEIQIQSYFNGQHGFRRKDGQAKTERLVEGLPGVSVISRGAYAQEPVIRGMSDGQVMLNIDGMKIFGACTDRMDPATSYVEPNNLQSIHLSHGPDFNASGATIGGALNFNLKKPSINAAIPLQTMVGLGFETNALVRQALGSLQYSAKKFALGINAIYKKADNYTPGGNKNDLQSSFGNWTPQTGFSVDDKAHIRFSQYEKWNAGLSAKYQLNQHNSLNADYIIDRGKNIGYPALTMDVAFANADIVSFSHEYSNNKNVLQAIETKLYYNHINHAMDDTRRPAEQVVMHMDMPGQSATAGFYTRLLLSQPHQAIQLRLESYLNRWHAAMTMYPDNGSPMFMLTIPDAQRSVTGLDITDNIHINNRTKVTAGMRVEYNASSVYTAQGRDQLSGIYTGDLPVNRWLWNAYIQPYFELAENWNLNIKFARAQRAATVKELYSFYLYNRVDGFDFIGNPALKNENAFTLDAALQYSAGIINADLKGFANFLQNYIAGKVESGYSVMTPGASGVKRYDNVASAAITGAELSLQLKPLQRLLLSSMNTFLKGFDVKKQALPMISPFHSTNKAEWMTGKGWDIFAESVYASAQKRVSSFYGEQPTPAFNAINAGIVKTFYTETNKITASLAGLNIFNQYYYEHVDVIKLPRPGRSLVLHVSIYL